MKSYWDRFIDAGGMGFFALLVLGLYVWQHNRPRHDRPQPHELAPMCRDIDGFPVTACAEAPSRTPYNVMTVFVPASASPTYACPQGVAAGDVVVFLLAAPLTYNITSSVLTNCPANIHLEFRYDQGPAGGHKVVMPPNFDFSCDVDPDGSSQTMCRYFWDGTYAQMIEEQRPEPLRRKTP